MHVITDFIRQLPGTATTISVSSMSPEDIVRTIIKRQPDTDFVVLYNGDVWRYRTSQVLLDFLNNYPTTFIIVTIGVDYLKISNNVLEVPLPDALDVVKNKTKFVHERKKYGYSSINNRQSWPRLLLGYQLWRADQLKNIIYSQNLIDEFGKPLYGYEQILFESLPEHSNFLSLLPVTWHEQRQNFAHDHNITHDAFTQSYANIVVETETEFFGHDQIYPTPTITEKSLKPFLSGQVPVLLAAQGVVAFLEQHGFYLFRDLFPLQYDQKLTEDKVDEIVNLVLHGDAYIEHYYFRNKDALEQNFIHLADSKYQQSILNCAVNFINENL